MPSSYRVQQGDTYEVIARKVYGNDQKAPLLRRGNPGADEPLAAGSTVVVPDDPDYFVDAAANRAASEPNEVALTVAGTRFRFWTSVAITLSLDTQSAVEFEAPFEPDMPEQRALFKPFSYSPVSIDVGGVRLFTGTMVAPTPKTGPDGRTVSVACYSTAGVMGDCTAPASAYPLEWSGTTLQTIAAAVAGLFGLSVEFTADPGPVFERAALSPGTMALDFLSDLAAQRNFVIGASPDGRLRFTRESAARQVVAKLAEGLSPLISVTPQFSPQDYYSHVTGIAPVVIGLAGTQFTVKNARLADSLRPYVFEAGDTADNTIEQTVQTKAGRMAANAVAYELEVATWRDQSGNLWAPGSYISLFAPGAMVYSAFTMLVRSVRLNKSDSSETATLTVILPGTLSGKLPERMPWDE